MGKINIFNMPQLRLLALALVATASAQELTSEEGTIVARSVDGRCAHTLTGKWVKGSGEWARGG